MKLKHLIQAPENESGGGGTGENGGTTNDGKQDSNSNGGGTSNESDNKTVGGIKFYKEQLETERKEREKIARELEEIRTAKLKEQNQWKDLYEQEQKKASELSNKLTSISSALVQDKMRSAIEREAVAAGILPSALEDLDLVDKTMIEVETTSQGRINFHNVKEFVDSLKIKRPHWFGSGREPNINNKKGDYAPPAEMSAEQILELQTKDPAKYYDMMDKRLGRK